MKNKTERRKTIIKRVHEILDSKEFRHQMEHHTDLDIHDIEVMNSGMWITLKDGTNIKVGFTYSEGKNTVDTRRQKEDEERKSWSHWEQ